MNAELAVKVAKWIRSWPQTSKVVPIRLQVGLIKANALVFYGARFFHDERFASNMLSVLKGNVQAGEIYLDTNFYLLGSLPYPGPVNSTVFRFGKDSGDWYISSRMQSEITPEFQPVNPFGRNWTLVRWDHEEQGVYIDTYNEPKTRCYLDYQVIPEGLTKTSQQPKVALIGG